MENNCTEICMDMVRGINKNWVEGKGPAKLTDVNAEYIVNWHLNSALLWLKEFGLDFRVVRNDGVDYMITGDYKPERLNLHIENGFVNEITYG